MAKIRRINSKAVTDENTGFGTNSALYGGRLINRNGRANVRRTGIGFFASNSWYHTLIEMSRLQFLVLIFAFFLLVNLLFAFIYFGIGVEHLGGMDANTTSEKFIEAYFFSAQTFTTVGYGRINPTGYLTSFVAAFEAFCGLLFFALATGLFYARFSRPKAFIQFADKALIAPYKNGIAFMCRLVPYKNTHLTDAEAKLTLGVSVEENGKPVNRFFPLKLEIAQINALNLSWTLVHAIDDQSPLYNLSMEDLQRSKAEVLVFLKAFDETFSNTIVARTSYISSEIAFGEKFIPMYHRSQNGSSTVLELDKLNDTEQIDISNLVKTGDNNKLS
jgi:inward rectifier potassium channel